MKPGTPPVKSACLLDQVQERVRCMHYSLKTERAYLYWIRFFIRWSAAQGAGMRRTREIIDLPWLINIGRPQKTKRIPSVLLL